MDRNDTVRLDYSATRNGVETTALSCTIIESGHFALTAPMHYDHPRPAFTRLFLFRAAGCEIEMNGFHHMLSPHTPYILPAGVSFNVDYPAGCELFFVHLHLRDGSGLAIDRELRSVTEVPVADAIAATIFDSYLLVGDGSALLWQSAVLQIAARLARETSKSPHPRRVGRYRHLLAALQASCTADITIAALAERERVTPAALSKGFQREVGISLSAYMTQLLIDQACDLLASTDLSAQAIAERLGYTDPFYFHRVFKKHTGVSPIAYRRMAVSAKRFG